VRVDRWARALPRPLRLAWAIVGTIVGFALGGYTGVLVTGTSVPFWHNAQLLGALFLLSAASSAYALLMLILMRHGRSHHDRTVEKLARADQMTMIIELLVLLATILLLGRVARPMIAGGYGVIFWLGVVGVGLVAPLLLHRVPWGRFTAHRRAVLGATCVLVGGLLLRFVVVMAPQWPEVRPWHL
jgi:protein NrfD